MSHLSDSNEIKGDKMKTIQTIQTVNGKLTKREIVRRMYEGAAAEERASRYALSYIARRLSLTIDQTRYFLTRLTVLGMIEAHFDKKSVVFDFAA